MRGHILSHCSKCGKFKLWVCAMYPLLCFHTHVFLPVWLPESHEWVSNGRAELFLSKPLSVTPHPLLPKHAQIQLPVSLRVPLPCCSVTSENKGWHAEVTPWPPGPLSLSFCARTYTQTQTHKAVSNGSWDWSSPSLSSSQCAARQMEIHLSTSCDLCLEMCAAEHNSN